MKNMKNNEEKEILLNGEVITNIQEKKANLKKMKKALAMVGLTMGITATSTMLQGNNTSKDSRIVNYVQPEEYITNVVPSGYDLSYDKDGNVIGIKTIKATTKTIVNSEGKKEIVYVVPNGYDLSRDINDNYVGKKIIKAEEKVRYSLPNGYVLIRDENGNLVGKKVITNSDEQELSLKK